MDDVGGLYFAQARRYDAGTGRFVSEDKVRGFVEAPVTLNRYGYCWGRPTGLVDLNGLYVQYVAAALVGMTFNVATRVITDLTTGHVSSWQEYVGDMVGGAVGGLVFAGTGNATLAGAANGFASTLVTNSADNFSGKKVDSVKMLRNIATNAAVGAGLGYLGGKYTAYEEGVNAGRGSYKQITRMLSTQMKNGTMLKSKNGFLGVSWKNWYKAFVWQLTEQDACASVGLGFFNNSGITGNGMENLVDKMLNYVCLLFETDCGSESTSNGCYIMMENREEGSNEMQKNNR